VFGIDVDKNAAWLENETVLRSVKRMWHHHRILVPNYLFSAVRHEQAVLEMMPLELQ